DREAVEAISVADALIASARGNTAPNRSKADGGPSRPANPRRRHGTPPLRRPAGAKGRPGRRRCRGSVTVFSGWAVHPEVPGVRITGAALGRNRRSPRRGRPRFSARPTLFTTRPPPSLILFAAHPCRSLAS